MSTTTTDQDAPYTWEPPDWARTWQVAYPDELEVVGTIRFVDEVRNGDAVWFDRGTPGVTLVRLASRTPPAGPRERLYRLERGAAPDSIRIVAIEGP